MFAEMRRKEREISTEEAQRILTHGDYGVLSMFDEEFPYGIPLNYVYVDHALYFHGAKEGHKLRCLRRNPRVSFCVTGRVKQLPEELTTAYESVVVFGKAHRVEGEEKRKALGALLQKYAPDHPFLGTQCSGKEIENTEVVKIEILHMSGKANQPDRL